MNAQLGRFQRAPVFLIRSAIAGGSEDIRLPRLGLLFPEENSLEHSGPGHHGSRPAGKERQYASTAARLKASRRSHSQKAASIARYRTRRAQRSYQEAR